jgi:hypothetical protein
MAEATHTINVQLSTAPTYECGAVLFSYLAFPEDAAEARRADVHAALCHLALRATGDEDTSWLWTPALIKPGYALMREDDVKRAVRTMDSRLRDRLGAAIVAKALLEELAPDQQPRLPPGVDRPSIAALNEYVMFRSRENSDHGDVRNFHTRVWRATLPVIHVAVALNVLFERTLAAGMGTLAVHDLVRSPEALAFLLQAATDLEHVILANPRFGISAKQLIRFRGS